LRKIAKSGNLFNFFIFGIMHIRVIVFPESKKEEIEKLSENKIILKIKEKAQKGEANQKVIKVLKEFYPSSKIRMVKGGKSKNKIFYLYET